jgi:cellulose 1,4-beta-cellobiosidase
MGNHSFYGPGLTVDTTSKFTVVTQFLTDDGTSTGVLSEIKRFYVQNGVVIANAQSDVPGVTGNSITTEFCTAQKTAFNNTNSYAAHGGMASMTSAFNDGMVLVMSLWDDYYADCLWLDSTYPTDSDPSVPGNARGTCPITSGVPATVESQDPSAYVIFENIKVGAINSTFAASSVVSGGGGGGSSTSSASVLPASSTTAATTSSAPVTTTSATGGSTGGGTVAQYGQCGGLNYQGSTACVSPYICQVQNAYYSQCL